MCNGGQAKQLTSLESWILGEGRPAMGISLSAVYFFSFEACTCCFFVVRFCFVLYVVLRFFLVFLSWLFVFLSYASFLLGRKREFPIR